MKKQTIFFISFLLLGLRQADGEGRGPQNRTRGGEGNVQQSLKLAELHVLQNSNHQLGELELGRKPRYSIPFDKAHFSFNDSDWTVFDLPESIIVSDPQAGVAKELLISTTIRAASRLKIRYQIHLFGDNPQKPSLKVFLISNGTQTLLKEEKPEKLWRNSTLMVETQEVSQLLFVGVLNDRRNRMALGNFTVEDLTAVNFAPRRYGETSDLRTDTDHLLVGSVSQENASVQMSQSSSRVESNFSEAKDSLRNHSPRRSQVRIDPLQEAKYSLNVPGSMDLPHEEPPLKGINPDYNDASHKDDLEMDVQKQDSASNVPDGLENVTPGETVTSTSQDKSKTPNEETTSVGGKVLILFVVLMAVGGISIFILFLYRKRKRSEDEVPVFSRASSSSEHGNPTFVSDQTNFEIGMNGDKPVNYKSFE